MIKLNWSNLSRIEKREALARSPSLARSDLSTRVREIILEVKAKGDLALRRLTRELDGVDIDNFEVAIPETLATPSIARAANQIARFHQAQLPRNISVETSPGIRCERIFRPIQSVGLYVPGGSAPLISTVLMLGIPARLAECPEIVLCTPSVEPKLFEAARVAGVSRVFRVGGAQAIAAMAYGTESIPKVDKIFGPGNAWVTEAKQQVAQDPNGAAIDMPAGPSEVLVIADADANPEFVVWDLLSQAEHGEDSQVLLVSDSEQILESVRLKIEDALADLPRRKIAEMALSNSRMILVESIKEAIEVSNLYAPEHLILQVRSPEHYTDRILHAGSVFLGAWSPESVGDYASGTNHVLPTYGYARSYSGLSVEAFFKTITFQSLSESGLKDIGPVVEILAGLEGLEAHKRAVSVRLKELS